MGICTALLDGCACNQLMAATVNLWVHDRNFSTEDFVVSNQIPLIKYSVGDILCINKKLIFRVKKFDETLLQKQPQLQVNPPFSIKYDQVLNIRFP